MLFYTILLVNNALALNSWICGSMEDYDGKIQDFSEGCYSI